MSTRTRALLFSVLCLAALVLFVHLAVPPLLRSYLNDKLADMGDYHGHLESIELSWWLGAYRIEGLRIEKKNQRVPVPLLDAPSIDLSVNWRALIERQELVGRARFERPEVNFVDGGKNGEDQAGAGVDWRDQLQKLLPITLDEVRWHDGKASFRNFNSNPPVNLSATHIEATVYHLTNRPNAENEREASIEATAQLFDQAPLEFEATFDPLLEWENFDVRLRVSGAELTRLNDFAQAYGRFDFAGGTGDLVIEAKTRDSEITGYIKPLLHDVEVFDWKQDVEQKGFLDGLWEALVGGGENLLKNQRKDQFATRVDISGNLKQDASVNPLQALLGILRNAFVEAFSARFENPRPT